MGNEKYIIGPYEKGKIYECLWFDSSMDGCSARFKAVMRKGRIVFKELDSSRVHSPEEFYHIRIARDQYPHEIIVIPQIED